MQNMQMSITQDFPSSCSASQTNVLLLAFAAQDDFLEKEFNQADDCNAETYQCSGVLPSELDQKLCHLLIEQQEGQIVELESELRQTHSKLHEKEAELQALKDCVRRLTEFSLGNASGITTSLSCQSIISTN